MHTEGMRTQQNTNGAHIRSILFWVTLTRRFNHIHLLITQARNERISKRIHTYMPTLDLSQSRMHCLFKRLHFCSSEAFTSASGEGIAGVVCVHKKSHQVWLEC